MLHNPPNVALSESRDSLNKTIDIHVSVTINTSNNGGSAVPNNKSLPSSPSLFSELNSPAFSTSVFNRQGTLSDLKKQRTLNRSILTSTTFSPPNSSSSVHGIISFYHHHHYPYRLVSSLFLSSYYVLQLIAGIYFASPLLCVFLAWCATMTTFLISLMI